MKFVLASYGTRGDLEPCAAVGRELFRRGHDVRIAVPPDLVGFVEAVGLAAVAVGPNVQAVVDSVHHTWTNRRSIQDQIQVRRADLNRHARLWRGMSAGLVSLANGADLLITAQHLEEVAANVAEYYDIPLATLHHTPIRANGQLSPLVSPPLARSAMTVREWLVYWGVAKKIDAEQRRELGLPKTTGPSSRRMEERGSLEIQAYDEACFPGLAADWAQSCRRRPFVGTLTLASTTDADDDVASWIVAGTPPICFGFGSMLLQSTADTVGMISAACAQLGERALICSGGSDVNEARYGDHVKVVGPISYAAIFPTCRAVVHHGGAGTTAAGLRAGVPTLSLPTFPDQLIWGTQVKRLQVGTVRRFSSTTSESLVADLRQILAPEFITRARDFATRMTKPSESVGKAADLVENLARSKPAG